MLNTKERITAYRSLDVERYIRSTHPVLYLPLWKRESGNTNQFTSDDAYGHLCTVTGATWGLQGRSFNGTSDKIAIASFPGSFPVGNAARSMLAWLNSDVIPSVTSDCAIGYGEYDTSKMFTIFLSEATGTYQFGGYANDLDSGVSVSTNWDLVAVTHDGTTTTIYVNDETPVSGAKTLNTTAAAFAIGQFPNGANFFDGAIGKAFLYNRALTAVEYQYIYLATKGRYK